MSDQQIKPRSWRLLIGILMAFGSMILFSFGLLIAGMAMSAARTGIGFFAFTTVISLGIFIWGFWLIHKWAKAYKAYRTLQPQTILPGGLWRWLVVPVVSMVLLFLPKQVPSAQREGYAYFLVLLFLLSGIYCACVRMPHYFLVDGIVFLFAAGYLAHAAFVALFPSHPSELRIFSIVITLLFLHGGLSIWGYWKIRREGKK